MKLKTGIFASASMMVFAAAAFTTASVPQNGVYRFTFGVSETQDGSIPVPANAVCDVKGAGYYDGSDAATFSYGFLGTTAESYKTDIPAGSKVNDPRQIDGFAVVEGQYIVLRDAEDLKGKTCVSGPAMADYLPSGASPYEGRYPVRFAMRAEERAYYAVTCTVANASTTANADVTLYSERSHLHAHHMKLAPGETRTFAWSVELAPNFCKTFADSYRDNAINVAVVGENAALAELTVVRQPQTAGTVRGSAVDNMNVGKSIWICTDSTGCDYGIAVPFFSLQNYGGVGAGLSRWAPADISICNQGEGGLNTASDTHRKSCLLKPGDYLYVEYGHNDNDGINVYTNNMEVYLSDAKAAGAKLLIVSPVERHTAWDATTEYWKSSLASHTAACKAWVEDKIAQGETCVAYVDLNTAYLNWMNGEVDRICGKFPSMNRSAAINYYYQSAKGKNVDGTHLNTAGQDQGAYWFWQAARAAVAAGEAENASDSQRIQAAVLKGITDGYQDKLGIGGTEDNIPWLVTDEIIEAGVAPNAFWDTPVTTLLDYVNEAAVANVAAVTEADGTVTISSATMRILNPGNYYKAVYDIVSADGATTNRYYSWYNYDVGGLNASSGTLINPEQPGFIDTDRAAGGSADRTTLSVPAGGRAYVWFAKADDATWQVGANGPCSAKYPVEAWRAVLVNDGCAAKTDAWSVSTQSEYTFDVSSSGEYFDFTGTGYAADGKTKKNFGMFRAFDDDGGISGGRYRVSFRVLYTAGSFTFCVVNKIGSTTSPTEGALNFVKFAGNAAEVFGSSAAEITLAKNVDGVLVPSNKVNVDAWTDVDMIVDMDLGTAEVSVCGSEYVTCPVPAYSANAAIPNLPYRYFAFSLESQMSHFGAIDDVKVLQLAATSALPSVTVSAKSSDADLGAVTIDGAAVTRVEVEQNSSVTLVATPVENCAFLGWLDEDGNYESTDATYTIERCHNAVSLTADFRAVAIVSASTADATKGRVQINGGSVSPLQVYTGTDVALTAVSADVDMYAFDHWEDAEGNTVSIKQTLVIEDVAADCAYTAVFREYGHNENRVTTWDFSEYAVASIAATGNQTVDYSGMRIFLQSGDTITGDGIRWENVGLKKWDGTVSASGRHIEWTAPADGDFSLTFQISAVDTGKKVYPYMCVATNEQSMVYSSSAWESLEAKNIDTDYTISFSATKGTLYKLYVYYQNRDSAVRVSSATFSYAPTFFTATAAVNNANYGSATANGAAAASVFGGKNVTFVATPASSAYRFVNWTDGEENVVSTEATFTATVSADVTYTANFEKAAAGDVVEMRYDFGSFTGGNAVTESGSQKITSYGPFEIYTSDSNRGNDSITENGIFWHVPANDIYYKNYNADQPCDYVHYIKFTAPVDGAVSMVFKTDTVVSNRKLSLCVTTGELSAATWNNKIKNVEPAHANTDYALTQEVTAGTTYWFWCASQNWDAGNAPTATTISSITYTHASDLTTLTVSNSDATAGTVTVNGAAVTESIDVQKGEYVHLVATPNAGGLFGGWKNDSEEVVSTETDFWFCVEEATSLTATWRTVDTHSFTWNWNVSEGDWNDPANWLYEGVVPATTYPNDAESDYVTFNTAAMVNLGGGASAKEVWLNDAVTFTNGTLTALLVTKYEDDGRAILANAGFANPKNLAAEISCPIVMAAGTINWFNKVSDGDWKDWMTVSGNISGEGRYNVNLANVQGNGIKFTGNNNDFHGDVYTSGGKSNRSMINWSDNNANTFLHIGHSYRNDDRSEACMGGNPTFGGYEGVWVDKWDNRTITVGSLNRYSEIHLYNCHRGYLLSLTKVGTANLRLISNEVKNLTISGGSVTMPVGIAPQTLTIAEGTSIIIPGDAAWTVGTVTNLFSYTTLAGAGTLAQQVEVTGLAEGLVAKITVADNTVTATIEAAEVAPTTDDENATITKNGDGTYTVQVEAEAVAITVPDGVTVREVVVSPDTATVTGVPANATVKVAVSWADAQETQHSAAYAIVKVNFETGAVSLDEDAVVTVGDEEIALRPQLSDAGDEVSPLDVGETVSVGVKSIPGLIYSLARGTAPNEIDTSAANVVAEEKAISSRVSLVDDNPPSNGAFYKVTVDMKVRHGTF